MLILHKADAFFDAFFPGMEGEAEESPIRVLPDFCKYRPYKLLVSFAKGWVTVEIDTLTFSSRKVDYSPTMIMHNKNKSNDRNSGNYSGVDPIQE